MCQRVDRRRRAILTATAVTSTGGFSGRGERGGGGGGGECGGGGGGSLSASGGGGGAVWVGESTLAGWCTTGEKVAIGGVVPRSWGDPRFGAAKGVAPILTLPECNGSDPFGLPPWSTAEGGSGTRGPPPTGARAAE